MASKGGDRRGGCSCPGPDRGGSQPSSITAPMVKSSLTVSQDGFQLVTGTVRRHVVHTALWPGNICTSSHSMSPDRTDRQTDRQTDTNSCPWLLNGRAPQHRQSRFSSQRAPHLPVCRFACLSIDLLHVNLGRLCASPLASHGPAAESSSRHHTARVSSSWCLRLYSTCQPPSEEHEGEADGKMATLRTDKRQRQLQRVPRHETRPSIFTGSWESRGCSPETGPKQKHTEPESSDYLQAAYPLPTSRSEDRQDSKSSVG